MSNILLYIFGAVIFILFVISFIFIFKNKRNPFVENSPSLLTTIGILGTFIGITWGLINFDFSCHDSIDKSIPYFLEGLKLAFLTSVFGIIGSIIIKLCMNIKDSLNNDLTEYSDFETRFFAYCDNNIKLMSEIKEVVNTSNDNMKDLKKTISGEGDASVVTQIQKFRTDLNDNHNVLQKMINENSVKYLKYFDAVYKKINENNEQNQILINSLREDLNSFAEKISETSSKHLIEALNDVIRDFNKNLTEQFGDNFKKLDESVGKLVVWQKQYKDQMENMKLNFEYTVQSMDISQKTLEKVGKESEKISDLVINLKEFMDSANSQLKLLENNLGAFVDMKEKAASAIPEIEDKLDNIMNAVRISSDKASEHYNILLDRSNDFINNFVNSSTKMHTEFVNDTDKLIKETTGHIKKTSDDVLENNKNIQDIIKQEINEISSISKEVGTLFQQSSESINKIINNFEKKLEDVISNLYEKSNANVEKGFNEQSKYIQQLSAAMKDELLKGTKEIEKLLNKGIQVLDESMQHEITRSLDQMGNQLARITEKFANDYSSLTEKMGEVVNKVNIYSN